MSEETAAKKKGRPPVVETPEFAEAVANAVAKQMAALEAKLASRAPDPATAAVDIDAILTRLADKLGEGFAMNSGRKPLSAEEKGRRDAAHRRMVVALEKAAKLQEEDENHPGLPSYAVMSKIAFLERFIEPFQRPDPKGAPVRTIITWTGVPNHALEPQNELATEIFGAWNESVGGPPALLPTQDNRPVFVTARGLVVRGDPPKRREVGPLPGQQDSRSLGFRNGDPAAPDVAVLGTIAPRAKMNTVNGIVPSR